VIGRNAPREWRLTPAGCHHFGPSYAAGPRLEVSVAIEK